MTLVLDLDLDVVHTEVLRSRHSKELEHEQDRPPDTQSDETEVIRTATLTAVIGNKSAQSNLERGPRCGAVAHVVCKVPIGYNGVPQIRLQNYPFPWTDFQTPPPASSLDPSDLWCQTVSGSDPPFFHNALDRLTDWPTDERTDRQIVHGKVWRLGCCATGVTRSNINNVALDWGRHECDVCCCVQTRHIQSSDDVARWCTPAFQFQHGHHAHWQQKVQSNTSSSSVTVSQIFKISSRPLILPLHPLTYPTGSLYHYSIKMCKQVPSHPHP